MNHTLSIDGISESDLITAILSNGWRREFIHLINALVKIYDLATPEIDGSSVILSFDSDTLIGITTAAMPKGKGLGKPVRVIIEQDASLANLISFNVLSLNFVRKSYWFVNEHVQRVLTGESSNLPNIYTDISIADRIFAGPHSMRLDDFKYVILEHLDPK